MLIINKKEDLAMKKTLSLLLALMMLLSCTAAMAEGKYEEHIEFTYLGNATSRMLPTDDAYIIQKLNEYFNVTIHSIDAVSNLADQMNQVFADYENIPNFFLVSTNLLPTALEQEVTREVPLSMIQEYAPTVYDLIMTHHPQVKKTAVYNKENDSVWAFPSGIGEMYPMMMVRQDWLDTLNLEIPTNLEEFKQVAHAFAHNDPDGNGEKDTWALVITETYANIAPLAAAFGITLPEASANKQDSWYIDEEGQIAYKAQTSEQFKALIKYLNELYKDGCIYTDLSLSGTEGDNLVAEGKIGFHHFTTTELLPNYTTGGWCATLLNNVPGAKVSVVTPLEGSVFEKQTSPWRYHCFGWNCPDEVVIRILQIYEEQCTNMDIHKLIWSGEEGIHYTLENGMAVKTEEYSSSAKQVEAAIKWMIINFRYAPEMRLFTFGPEYNDVDKYNLAIGTEGSNTTVRNELIPFGISTPVITEHKSILDPFEKEFFFNGVAGNIDVDAEWEKYLEDWNKAGGEASAKEAYEIWKSLQ